jgi:membrane-bound lytic murein transglycosylase D
MRNGTLRPAVKFEAIPTIHLLCSNPSCSENLLISLLPKNNFALNIFLASPALFLYRPRTPRIFCMRAIKVTFALSLGLIGIFGCATNERSYHRSATSGISFAQPKASVENIPNSSAASILAPTSVPRSPEPAALEETNALPPTSDAKLSLPPNLSEGKPELADDREKSAPPVKPGATAVQSERALQADNRLLDLLEKDLDKAVEQPPEHRRLQFSKEVIENAKVRHFVNYYSVTARNSFAELLARSGKYIPMIATVLAKEGLPKELGYLALLESQFVLDSTSRNGAVGLWQFVASTARQYGLRIDQWVDERRDPVKSTRAAAAYLKDLHDYYGRWFLVTAAYNAGPGNVDKALRQSQAKDFWSIKAKARLSEETRNFVPKFIAIALIASDPTKYGFHDIQYLPPLDYEEVELVAPMNLEALAALAETDRSTVKELNPALLRNTTPPGEPGFRVNLPVGKAQTYLAKANERNIEKESTKDVEPVNVVTHEVKRGETLFSIARFYGLTVRALMDFNGLKTPQLKIGQKLGILLQGIRARLR